MEMNQLQKQTETKMSKSIAALESELTKIRTGRAHPGLLDHITVDYYGNKTPLNQLCNIAVQDAKTLSLKVWEKTMVEPIEKAIINAKMSLNPAVSGTVVRIPIPPLSEERRKELVKIVRQHGEAGKVAIRNIRRDLNQHLKHALKDKEISKDEEKDAENLIQQVTNAFVAKIDDLLAEKEKELMTI